MKEKNFFNWNLVTTMFAVAAVFVLALAVGGTTVLADNADAVLESAEQVGGGDGASSISDLIKTIINILSWIAGVISVVIIIIAGLRISLSNGDSSKVASGRNAILYALVGLVVVIFAQVIVRFVLTNVGT